MFRLNNPDALLTLLLIGSVYATLRALESPERAVRWLALGGALVGFAFLTKMLQAFLVLPPLALVYLIAAKPSVGVRLRHLLVAFGSMIAASGWWIAIVELWPASSRPYIGGSQHNSILELTLGYNGFGRLSGNETGSVGGGGGPGGGGAWGSTGLFRLFNSEIGGQIAWLLPASLALLALGLWFRRSAGRTDRQLSGLIVWGGWLLVTGLTFSFMAGIFHAYYTVALAPAIAAVVAIGASLLWEHRTSHVATLGAAFVIAMTAAMSYTLLGRSASFIPWLKYVVGIAGVAAAFLLVLHRYLARRALVAVAIATVISTVAGPAAYAVDTATTPHSGSIPTAGPNNGGQGGPGGGMRGMGQPPNGAGGMTGRPGQTTQGQTGQGQPARPSTGRSSTGGLLTGSRPTSAFTKLLQTDASSYTWAAAAIGSNTASGYQLAAQLPVMAIGGFNGSDPSPTLAQFKQYVADGEIHYFIASGGNGGGPGNATGSTSTQISTWVAANFTAKTVDGVTVYDLSGGIK
jgi:4-amino-4-deoxy-L-arabinose transferase-like glycosyltransferase